MPVKEHSNVDFFVCNDILSQVYVRDTSLEFELIIET